MFLGSKPRTHTAILRQVNTDTGAFTETEGTFRSNGVATAGGRLVIGAIEGVWISGTDDLELTKVPGCWGANRLSTDGRHVYMVAAKDDTKTLGVGWLDIEHPQRCLHHAIGDWKDRFRSTPTDRPGVALIRDTEARWLALVDVGNEQTLWHYQPDGLKIWSAVWTPAGCLAILMRNFSDYTLVKFNPDGSFSPYDPGLPPGKPDKLFWLDGVLVVDLRNESTHVLHAFEWVADGGEA